MNVLVITRTLRGHDLPIVSKVIQTPDYADDEWATKKMQEHKQELGTQFPEFWHATFSYSFQRVYST